MALRQGARRLILPFGAAAGAAALLAAQQQQHLPPFAPFAGLPMSAASAEAKAAAALDPSEWRPLRLAAKTKLTHNSYELRFALPDPEQEAGLPVASCLLVKAALQGPGDEKPKAVIRPYTPTSAPDAKGHLDLVVKAYPDGKLSKHLGDMKVGDAIEFKGPIVKFPYERSKLKEIGMVAGGTGITPMLQVVEWILRDPSDTTKVRLVYGNVSEADVLLKARLDALAAKHPGRFSVHYVVDKARLGGALWKGSVGYITKDLLAKHMPAPAPGNMVFVCGPPGLMKAVSGDKAPDKSQGELAGALKDLGYAPEQVFKF